MTNFGTVPFKLSWNATDYAYFVVWFIVHANLEPFVMLEIKA